MRWKLDGRIEPRATRIAGLLVDALDTRGEKTFMSGVPHFRAPDIEPATWIGDRAGAVDEQEGPPRDAHVSRVREDRKRVRDECDCVFVVISLRDQDFVIAAIPMARPVLVRPADAEWKIGSPLASTLASGRSSRRRPENQ